MKHLLFITHGSDLDYQNDTVFHGLCSLPETEVAILNENNYDYMFKGLCPEEKLRSLYGKGFTLSNRVPVEKKCVHSRDEALKNIRDKYYDFVVYGSIFRCDDLLSDVVRYYPRNKILLIDGEDEDFHFRLTRGCRYRFFLERRALKYAGKGLYFKREMLPRFRGVFQPVSFAIPEELVVEKVPENKERRLAFIIPGNPDTYIYKDEDSYYKGYQTAVFGMTCRKAGWDCLRHYEILANGCIPYFPDIDELPPDTMPFFPRALIRYGNMLYESGAAADECLELSCRLLEHTRKFLTTRFQAEYLLSAAGKCAEMPGGVRSLV